MPKLGGSSSGGSGRLRSGPSPDAVVEEDQPNTLQQGMDELGQVFSAAPRAVAEIIGAIGGDIKRLGQTVVPGGNRGFLERAPEEAPDLLDDIGLGTLGDIIDQAEGRSSIIGSLISPGAESLATSFSQGFSGLPDMTFGLKTAFEEGARGLANLTGAEVGEGARLPETILSVAASSGNDTAQEILSRVQPVREMRSEQVLFPVIEDAGNAALVAGMAGGASSIAGRLTGSTRLSSIGRSSAAVRRSGTAAAREGFEKAGATLDPVGVGLGQAARPLRTTSEMAGLDRGLVTAARQSTADAIRRTIAESGEEAVDANRLRELALNYIDPSRATARKIADSAKVATRLGVSRLSQQIDLDTIEKDLSRRISRIENVLDADDSAVFRARYAEVASERGLDPLPSRARKISDDQLLAALDVLDEMGVRVRRDVSSAERAMDLDVNPVANELVRLRLYERVNGLEGVTDSVRATLELGPYARTLMESRRMLTGPDGPLDEATFRRILSLSDDPDALDKVLRFDTLMTDLDDEALDRVQQTARKVREFQGQVERTRADDLPTNRGSRLTPDGDVLPGYAPTRFDGASPSADNNRMLERATEKLDNLKGSLRKYQDAIDQSPGGEDLLTLSEEAVTARRQIYTDLLEAVTDTTSAVRNGLDPEQLDAAVDMFDQLVELGDSLDEQILRAGKPGYVSDAEQAVRAAMEDVRAQYEDRFARLVTEGRTPKQEVRATLADIARAASNITSDNALETMQGIQAMVARVREVAPEAGIDVEPALRRLEGALDEVDAVRNQRLTNQQRLRSLLLDEGEMGMLVGESARTVIEAEIRRLGTSTNSLNKLVTSVRRRLRDVDNVDADRVADALKQQLSSPEGRALRDNLPANVPRLKRQTLTEIARVTRDLSRRIEGTDPLSDAMDRLDDGVRTLRQEREQQLRGSVSQAQNRARSTLAERDRRAAAVVKAQARIDEITSDYLASPAAVPRAARTLVTAANRVFPEAEAALRTLDDPVATQLADHLATAPKNLKDLLDGEVDVTYVPDVAADPRTARLVATSDFSDPRPGYTRRQRASEFEVEQDMATLIRREVIDTFAVRMQRNLADEFTDRFTQKTDDVLRSLGEDVTEDMPYDAKARILTEAGYVQYVREDPFRTFRSPKATVPDDLWVKKELITAVEAGGRVAPEGSLLASVESMARIYYDPVINSWKGSVLALRPLWQVNNHIGNAALAMFSGKTSPQAYARFMATAIDLQRRVNSGIVDNELRILKGNPRSLLRAARGQTTDADVVRKIRIGDDAVDAIQESMETSLIDNDLARVGVRFGQGNKTLSTERLGAAVQAGKEAVLPERLADISPVQAIRDTAQASYRINSTVDDVNRALVTVANVLTGPDGRMNLDLDVSTADIQRAARVVNETFGSYQNLSAMEQSVLRRVFPFYTWVRHITGVLARHMTKVSEVERTLLFAHVVQVLGEPNAEEELLPEWASSRIFTGYNEAGVPQFINTRGGDPFSEGLQPFENLGSMSDLARFVARSSGPVGSILYERTTGQDVLSGEPLSGIGSFQGRRVTPSLPAQLSETLPQVRLVRDFIRERSGETTIRQDDDTPLPFQQDPMEGETTFDRFTRYMGVMWPQPLNTDAIRERELEEEEAVQRQRRDAEERSSGNVLQQSGQTLRSFLP